MKLIYLDYIIIHILIKKCCKILHLMSKAGCWLYIVNQFNQCLWNLRFLMQEAPHIKIILYFASMFEEKFQNLNFHAKIMFSSFCLLNIFHYFGEKLKLNSNISKFNGELIFYRPLHLWIWKIYQQYVLNNIRNT